MTASNALAAMQPVPVPDSMFFGFEPLITAALIGALVIAVAWVVLSETSMLPALGSWEKVVQVSLREWKDAVLFFVIGFLVSAPVLFGLGQVSNFFYFAFQNQRIQEQVEAYYDVVFTEDSWVALAGTSEEREMTVTVEVDGEEMECPLTAPADGYYGLMCPDENDTLLPLEEFRTQSTSKH